MKQLFSILVVSLFLITPCFANIQIEVLKVYDGDSILAKINNNIFRIRLIDIDCFEGSSGNRAKWQAKKYKISEAEVVKNGNLAKNILAQKLKNKKVYFEFRGIDKYNRALGYIYVENKNINKEMLNTGYCFEYIK